MRERWISAGRVAERASSQRHSPHPAVEHEVINVDIYCSSACPTYTLGGYRPTHFPVSLAGDVELNSGPDEAIQMLPVWRRRIVDLFGNPPVETDCFTDHNLHLHSHYWHPGDSAFKYDWALTGPFSSARFASNKLYGSFDFCVFLLVSGSPSCPTPTRLPGPTYPYTPPPGYAN